MFARVAIAAALLLMAVPGFAQTVTYGPYPEQTYLTCGNSTAKVAVALMREGWDMTSGADSGSASALCKYLGKRGVYVVNFNYRLTTTPRQGWPSQWQDAQLVVRWLRKGGYTRVGFIGLSAGAYDALGVAFNQNTIIWKPTDPLREAWLYTRYTSRPDFVVAVSPFSDLNDPKLFQGPIRLLTRDIFGTSTNITQQTRNNVASPISQLHPDIPPLLVIHGLNDPTVPVQQSQVLSDAMTSIGGTNMQLVLTNGGHIFAGLKNDDRLVLYKQILDCATGARSSLCAPKAPQ